MTAAAPSSRVQPGPKALPRMVTRLRDLARDGASDDCISIGHLARTIGAQGHAPLLMVVALFMILPVGMIPGIGGALGVLVAVIGLQILRGRRGVWLPGFIARREIPASHIARAADRIEPFANWLRHRLCVRWEAVASGSVSLGVIAVLLILAGGSLLVLGAVPVAAPLVGLPVAVFAVGILGRDGVVVAAGYVLIAVTLAAAVWMGAG